MFYRVILDCRPTASSTSQPFITIKFVEADDQAEATNLAIDKTKALMRAKGLEKAAIATFEFAAEEIEPLDPNEAEFDAEQSLIYYSDG